MDSVAFGSSIRALRRRKHWTQSKLAEVADVSQASVWRAERGNARDLTVRTLERIAEALGARVSLRVYWQGESLDRLLDAAHAGLVNEVVRLLAANGWQVIPEATFSEFGERGSVDVLAFHPEFGALLIVEVKSVVPDMQAMLSSMDRKVRLAPKLGERHGWNVRSISRVLVLPDQRTCRRRVEQHEVTIDLVMPARTAAIRSWVRSPKRALGGVLFLPPSQSTTGRHRIQANRAESAVT